MRTFIVQPILLKNFQWFYIEVDHGFNIALLELKGLKILTKFLLQLRTYVFRDGV